MSDEPIVRGIDAGASAELGGQDAPLTEEEHAELTELGSLLSVAGRFELSAEARQRGLAELETHLTRQAARSSARRPSPLWWWSVPVAAAVLLAWLVPLSPSPPPPPLRTPALVEAQSFHLTARLTGAPVPRDELERAQASYREELLASLEAR